MSRSRVRSIPPWRWAQIERGYSIWRAARHPNVAPPTDWEWQDLYKAENRTYLIDGDGMDYFKAIAIDVMDAWVAAESNPEMQQELQKGDYRIQ